MPRKVLPHKSISWRDLKPFIGSESPIAMNRVYRRAGLNPDKMRHKLCFNTALNQEEGDAIARELSGVLGDIHEFLATYINQKNTKTT